MIHMYEFSGSEYGYKGKILYDTFFYPWRDNVVKGKKTVFKESATTKTSITLNKDLTQNLPNVFSQVEEKFIIKNLERILHLL